MTKHIDIEVYTVILIVKMPIIEEKIKHPKCPSVFLRQALTLFQLVSTHRSGGHMQEEGAGPHSVYLMGVLASNVKSIIIL